MPGTVGASSQGGGGTTNSAGTNVVPKSDGTNLVASTITDNGTTVATTKPVASGANPSSTGQVRLPNDTNISFRNSTNNGDLVGLSINSSDSVTVGNTSSYLNLAGGLWIINFATGALTSIGAYAFTTTGAISGAAGTFSGVLINTGITSDAGHTDSTVCQDTTSHQFHSGTGAAGICLGTSSERFKHSVSDIKEGLAEILKLRPRNFFYKEGIVDGGARLQYGLVAEEVNEIMPNIVAKGEQGEINSVDYGALWPIFAKAIQELNEQFDAKFELLNTRLNTLLDAG